MAGTRSTTVLGVCATACLGLVFLNGGTLTAAFEQARSATPLLFAPGPADFILLAVPAIALLLWRKAPGRSWPLLLLAGAVCAVPLPLFWLGIGRTVGVLSVLALASTPLLTVGILGGAMALWHNGRPRTGAAIAGAAMVGQLVGAPVRSGLITVGYPESWIGGPIIYLVVIVVAGAAAAVAIQRDVQPIPVPDLRITLIAGLAAATPLIGLLWRPAPPARGQLPEATFGDHSLHLGLVFLAIGLITAGFFGLRGFLCATTAALILGAFATLLGNVPRGDDLVWIVTGAAVLSTVAGYFVAFSRLRAWLALGGIGPVVAGLALIYALLLTDGPADYNDFFNVLSVALLLIGTTAAAGAFGFLAETLAARSLAPAVLAGPVVPLGLGVVHLFAYFSLLRWKDDAAAHGTYPATIAAILLAGGLLVVLALRPAALSPPR
ncbi:hypothetical protein [Amycolatopsis sp. YIM 10]|uniref:hypothetical protein n=1 Tax=Amycolatopsis sp. YIM 10 TaxID=2653857 RepID=UPI00128FEA7B|nr:hypothetical protein [Amycolatopsis sp. YIM 10]QFU90284.1 hypothetical protein YIM_25540 [Amycolatopsis sp. YIM 10]